MHDLLAQMDTLETELSMALKKIKENEAYMKRENVSYVRAQGVCMMCGCSGSVYVVWMLRQCVSCFRSHMF